MSQELASIVQDPLLLVFLDLRKAYNTLDRGRLFQTLERYGAGTRMRGILEEFWENQEFVTRHNGHHVPQLKETYGTTQEGIASSTLFNVAINSVVHHWISLTL